MANIFKHISNRSLAHVIRFNSRPQHFHESVAEHSFFTTYIVSIICDLLEKESVSVNREKALSMALIHDSEEALSGDILSPFKHHSPEVKSAIKKVNPVPHPCLPARLRNGQAGRAGTKQHIWYAQLNFTLHII